MILTLLFTLPSILFANKAHAQVQNEPIEVVSETAPSTFSERSGYWPTDSIPEEAFSNESSTLNDRWNSIPGVQARENGSPTLSIRGSAQADRVLKLVDGAPLNMADGVGGSDLLIPTEILSGVSLIKGPASVFYGTSAMAGAVDHHLQYFDELTLGASLADSNGQFGDRQVILIAPFHLRAKEPNAQLSAFAEQNPDHSSSDHNFRNIQRVTAVTDLDLGRGLKISARAIGAQSQSESTGPSYSPLLSTASTQASLLTAQLSKTIATHSLASLRLTDTRIWGLYDENKPSQSGSSTQKTSLFADLNVPLAESIELKNFGDMSTNRLNATYVGNSTFWESSADLGQSLEWSVNSSIVLQPAYRYLSREGQILKAVAAVYSENKKAWSLKWGEGYRSPSLSDRYANYSTFISNPSLRPEKSWSAELEYAYESGRRYSGFLEGFGAQSSVFYTNYSDLVDTKTIGPNLTKVNAGDARAYGAELALAYGYRVWMASVGYSYLDSKNLTANEPLRLAPAHQATLTIAQLFGPVLIEAKETVWSSFFDRNPNTGNLIELSRWQTLDITFRTLALTDWEFRGGVMNLFNRDREFTYGYSEPGRRFFVAAQRSL